MNLGVREAARILGVSHVALLKAKKAGSLAFEADGKVNLDRVMQSEWAINRGLGKPKPVRKSGQPAAHKPRQAPAVRQAIPTAEPDDRKGLTEEDIERLESVRGFTASELQQLPKIDLEKLLLIERREKERLRNEERKRNLVDRVGVEAAIEGRAQAEKEALLNWPASVATEIGAALAVDERLVHQILDVKIREFLTQRSSVTESAA